MAELTDFQEFIRIDDTQTYDVLSAYTVTDREKAKLGIGELERLINNPIRGAVVEKNSITKSTDFLDVTIRKNELIDSLADRLVSPNERSEALSALWNIASSEDTGVDINGYAIDKFTNLDHIKDAVILNRLNIIANTDNGRNGDFAAFILAKNGNFGDHMPYDEKPMRTWMYIPSRIRGEIITSAMAFKNSADCVGIGMYADLEKQSRKNESSDVLADIKTKVLNAFARKKRYIIDKENEEKHSPPLGIEIQGLGTDALPVIGIQKGIAYTSASPLDYDAYKTLGSFIESPDKPYEFALKPKKSAYELALMVQALFKSGLIRSNNGSTGLDVTISGLKSSPESYREGMALQLMLLAADYGRFTSVMDHTKFSLSWDIDANTSGLNSKGATKSRDASELSSVGNESPEEATELRIFALDTPEETYKMLHLLQEIGSLAINHQQKEDHKKYSKARNEAWIYLSKLTNELFKLHNLPGAEEHWRYKDLKALNDLLESASGVQFRAKMRQLLTTARLRIHGHNEQLIRDVARTETKPAERINCVLRTLNAYDTKIRSMRDNFLVKHESLNQVVPYVDLVKKFIVPSFALTLATAVISEVPNFSTHKLLEFGKNIALFEVFTSPNTYLTAIRSFAESFQTRRITLSKDLYARLSPYTFAASYNVLLASLYTINGDNPVSTAWAACSFVAFKFGESVLKPFTRIESNWQEGHEK